MTISGGDFLITPDSKISEANYESIIHSVNVSNLDFVDAQPAKRKTASSSKERKKRYMKALERAVQSLQTQSTSLSAQLNRLQEDTSSLYSKRSDLKLRMQSMENEVHSQYVHNDELKEEIQELRAMVHQSIQNEAHQYKHQNEEINDIVTSYPSQSEDSPNVDPLYSEYRLF